MVDYREILRLDSDPTKVLRSIAAMEHSSRNTIREVRAAAKEAGVTWPLDEDVTNEELRGILFPNRYAGEAKSMRCRTMPTSTGN